MNILVIGDTHCDFGFWRDAVIPEANRQEVVRIIQLGDFGAWEHKLNGVKYLHRLNESLIENDLMVRFIDGNHENHHWLRSVYGQAAGQPEPRRVRSNIWWLPRGSGGNIEGMKWLACGGAYSIDKPRRIQGESWWPEETITDEEVSTCRTRGKADVLFSHDCPLGVNPWKGHGPAKTEFPDTQINRHRLTTVMNNARVKLVMHGHWHEYHDDHTPKGVRIVGLAANTNYRSEPAMALLDPKTLEVTPLRGDTHDSWRE